MKRRLCLIAAGLLLIPRPASASLWDYFDRLSGPGPYTTKAPYWGEFRVASITVKSEDSKKDDANIQAALARDDAKLLELFATVRFTSLSTERDVNQARVRLTPIDFAVMWRPDLGRLTGLADVGAGASVLLFSGAGFESFERVGLILPKITITPLGPITAHNPGVNALLHIFKIYGDLTWAGEFTAADFNNSVPPFSNDRRVLRRYGIQLDFMSIGYAATHFTKR